MIATFLVDWALFVAITLMFLKTRELAANYPAVNWRLVTVLAIGAMTVVTMLYSYKTDGFFFDLRSVPILLFSYLRGWKAGLAASALPMVYRLWLGGEGAIEAALITLLLPVLFGAMFHSRMHRSQYNLFQIFEVLIAVNLFFITDWIGGLLSMDMPFHQWAEIITYKTLFGNAAVITVSWLYNDSSRNRIIKREYEKLSNYDPKTGLPNIRHFHEKASALAANQPIFLLMIDIDHFKHYNDAHGHIIGDGLLKHFGAAIKRSIGDKGFVARYGGEEFVVALPADSVDTACDIAEWVRSDIEKTTFPGSEKQPYGKITASVGVSGPTNDLSTLIEQAEEALFIAKHQGKNRYCFYDDVAQFLDRAKLEQERDFFKNHYESILEASGDGICGLDSFGRITFANPAAVRLTGYRQEELVGKEIKMLFQAIPSEQMQQGHGNHGNHQQQHCLQQDRKHQTFPSQACPISMTLKDGVLRHQLDAMLYRKDESALSVEYICAPMIGRERVMGGVVTFIDNTERKKLQELARKSDRLDVIGNTAEGIAHEIRNPLTTLKGFLQFSKSKFDPNHYETMRRELDQIEFVIRELLVLSKPQEMQLQEIDFLDCVRQSIKSVSAQAGLQRTEILFRQSGIIPPVYGEKDRLVQLVLHLIRNALDSLEEEGNITISLAAPVSDQNSITLTIGDNGKGMPEDIVHKLGEPFYSTKTNGIGLGLTLCNQIVQQHKGELQIQSEINQGTMVTVKLPVYSPNAGAKQEKTEVLV